MKDELLTPLETTIHSAQTLLAETNLTVSQERFVQAILTVCRNIFDLLVSIPDLANDKAKEVLSYELRSNLASVIGYAEVLLDETDGPLDENQREHVQEIRAGGKQLLGRVARLWN
jgi:hypothetical protein